MKIFQLLLVLVFALSCSNNYGQLKTVAELPQSLEENSGIVKLTNDSVWFLEDSGNHNELYKVNFEGEILKTLTIKNAKNIDWEELAKDDKGNVYIGDFGNNKNERKDLTIYIIPNPEKIEGDEVKAKKITFKYPEQDKFPSKKKNKFFDCEAFFYMNGNLYLFTKDRSKPYKGLTSLYKIPAVEGDYKAELIDTFHFGDDYHTGSITAATISEDKSKVILLTHTYVYVLEDYQGENFFKGTLTKIDMKHTSQKESVCFKDEHTLLISDEAEKKEHPKLYELKI